MRKNLIILSLILVTFMAFNLVSAVDMVSFTSPENGGYVSDEQSVAWENGTFQIGWLKYQEGSCDGGDEEILMQVTGSGSYEWDTTELDDGDYCLKITGTTLIFGSINVTKDTTAPVIEFLNTPYFGITLSNVSIEASISDNGTISKWELDFGDGSDVVTGNSSSVAVSHNYTEEGSYEVMLTVVDNVSNDVEESVMVFISDEVFDFEITVFADEMNAFSIPWMPEEYGIKDVLGKEIYSRAEKIWSYQQGKWKYNVPTSSGWSDSSSRIKDIIPGYGYILFMKEDSVIRGKDREPGVNTPTEAIEMVHGWNFVGVRGNNKTIARTLSSINLVGSSRWNEVRDSDWNFITNSAKPDVGIMAAKRAYWVSIITDGESTPIYL